ncbi:MAG TPA: AI-2E family transporter [Caulobacteraceae bacterium]|nr:AI-2E family transporter [Caulobacteraceae bacterium]
MATRGEAEGTAQARRVIDPVVRGVAVFITVVLLLFLVRFFSAITTPLVVATFLMVLIDALARAMRRRMPQAPAWARDGLAGVFILAAFALAGSVIALEGPPFASQFTGLEGKLDGALAKLTAAVGIQTVTITQLASGIDFSSVLVKIFGAARRTVSFGLLVAIYFGFLLASRAAFGRKLERLYEGAGQRAAARRVTDAVRDAVERYVRLQTIKALAMALAGWIVFFAMGVNEPLFLAFVVFLSAYVPIIGPIAGVIFPSVVALAQFGDLFHPALLVLVFGTAVLVLDNVIMPKLASDALNIDPLLVLISIGLWGAVFGAPGVFLSTPLTVTVMAVAAEYRSTQWLAVLISKDGDPHGAIRKARQANAPPKEKKS